MIKKISVTSNLVEDWLTWLESLGGRSDKTIIAYRNDVFNFIKFMSKHFQNEMSPKTLKTIEIIDMRAWMAFERTNGLSSRSVSRKLSAIKSFFIWFGEQEGFEPTGILAVRSPRFHNKLPRPLEKSAAKNLISGAV